MFDRLLIRVAIMAMCGFAAYVLRHESWEMPAPYWHALILGSGLYAFSELLLPRLETDRRVWRLLNPALRLSLVAMILMAAAYALKISDLYSRLWSAYWLVLTWIMLALASLAATRRSLIHRRLVLVGEAHIAQMLAATYRSMDQDLDVLCLLPGDLLDWLNQQDATVDALTGTEILLLGRVPEPADRTAIILALHGNPVALRYCADPHDIVAGTERTSLPLIPLPTSAHDVIKRSEDILLAGIALLLCLPLFLIIALLIGGSGPGPILFQQRRLGLGGRAFTIYKFRTMVMAAAKQADVPQAEKQDGRITPIGAVLRRWGLDELPQLFNVLRGDMSLVGPRPHAFPHDMQWGAQLPHYAQRFRMRPGITGLAQICGHRGYADTIDDIAARLERDLHYIRTWSPALDMRILLSTLPYLLRHTDDDVSAPNQTSGQPLP